MLTYSQLTALHRSLRDRRVLSVYLDGSPTDPAIQRSWRVVLDQNLADLRRWLGDSPATERDEFERCVARLEEAISALDPGVGAPGWVAFITPDATHVAEHLPAPSPTLAIWSTGACVAPCARALKEERAVVVVLADARKSVLYRYRLTHLDRVEVVHAHHAPLHAEHMGTPSRTGFHPGTRGSPGRDAAQRALLKGRDRMIADTVDRLGDLTGGDGWIIVGGSKRVVPRLADAAAAATPNRVLALDNLDVHSTDAELAAAARAGASTLRNAADDRRIAEIAELSGAHGLGAVGADEISVALDQRAVRDLYITQRFLDRDTADAEMIVRVALDQDAVIEHVSGEAAEHLDKLGGIVAGLRFRPVAIDVVAAV